jgi:hypothetical protein
MKEEKSILLEAEDIVNGVRASDYGSAEESFAKIAYITNLMLDGGEKLNMQTNGEIGLTVACKVLMAVKLSRQSHKHKRDNLVDLCGYAELLNRIESIND